MRTKRKKPTDSAASKPPDVVMRVLTVSTKSEYISSRESVLVETFLHENGFVDITATNGQTTAIAPRPEIEGDPVIIIECWLGSDGKLSTMDMVRKDRDTSRLIDSGHVRFEYQNDGKGGRGFWAGGENIADWDITAVEDDSFKKPESPAKELTPVRVAAWRRNPRIQAFIQERCGGDPSMAAVSKAMNAIAAHEGARGTKVLCEMLGENHGNISLLLLPVKLHRDLQPLLDLPSDYPERITTRALRALVTLPIEAQVKAWKEAKKEATIAMALKVIAEIRSRLSSSYA